MPEIHIDTQTTFKKFKKILDNNQEKVNFADYIIKGNFLFKFFENDFETIIVPAYPEIGKIKIKLLEQGALFSVCRVQARLCLGYLTMKQKLFLLSHYLVRIIRPSLPTQSKR